MLEYKLQFINLIVGFTLVVIIIFLMAKYKQQKELMFAHPMKEDQQISQFLRTFNDLNISNLKDENESSVLHRCAYQNRLVAMRNYIEYMKTYNYNKNVPESRSIIVEWINRFNADGFSALHYASYKGNTQIIEYLLRQGGQLDLITKSGHNILHVAAQGNTVRSFIYLRGRKDINEVDEKGSSNLHWASYKNSQNVVDYLLAQPQIKINKRDKEGQTPLYLAAAYGNTRVVRKLLFAGADRTIANNAGQTPLQIAQTSEYWNIYNMLNNKYTILDYCRFYCNIKINYKPQDRQPIMPIVFVLLFLFGVSFAAIIVQFKYQWLEIIIGAFYAITLINYLTLIWAPKKPQRLTYQSLINSDLNMVCMNCINVKPRRSYHCDTCKVCIPQYDHHCPWINNCVGKSNIKRFVFFLISIELCLVGVIGFSILVLVCLFGNIDISWIFTIRDFPGIQSKIPHYIICIGGGLGSILMFGLLLALSLVQIKNLLLGQTTYERFSKNTRSILTNSKRSVEKRNFSRGNKMKIQNCYKMCYKDTIQIKQESATDSMLEGLSY